MSSLSRTTAAATISLRARVTALGGMRPGYLTVAVLLTGLQAVAGAVAAGVVLLAVEDTGPRFGIAGACLAVAALLAVCAVLLRRQRRREWPRWAVISVDVVGLVVALVVSVMGQPGGLVGVAACALALYALSAPEVIDWFGPEMQLR